jgi:hypothetical protein
MSIKNKTEFLECLRFKRESSSYRTEKRGFCVLSLRLSGNAKFIFDNKSVVVTPKNILFIPGNATYFQQAEKEEIIAIHFNAPHQNSHTLKVYTPKNFEHIKHLFIRLAETYSAMNDGYIFKANALFYELIFSLYREYIAPSGKANIFELHQDSFTSESKNAIQLNKINSNTTDLAFAEKYATP